MRRSALLLLCCWLGGCATLPRGELEAYNSSFRTAQAAADPLIAVYAGAERSARLERLRGDPGRFATRGYFTDFQPDDAIVVSTVGLPPGAEALDRAFRAIALYNEVLVALAENRNIDVARQQVDGIVAELGPVAATPAVPAVGQAARLLLTILSPVVQAGNRQAFRSAVIEGHPQVLALLAALRGFVPTQYSLVTASLRQQVVEASSPEQAGRARAAINTWHATFAGYYLLLGAIEARMNELKAAVENPRRRGSLERVRAGAAELRVYADALRRDVGGLAALR